MSKHRLTKLYMKKEWLILLLFLLLMLWIHRFIFLYADDLYYSRDAQYGLAYLPEAILDELNMNGRAWIGAGLILMLKPQITLFRILNPFILVLAVYILAKITTFSESSTNNQESNSNWIVLLSASLFFLFLPLRIAHTTIYYAACAFNYLYPMILALWYAYLLYSSLSSTKTSRKSTCLLIVLAFFVGSSTQQVGMIGIGFTVMISIYLGLIRQALPMNTFFPYYGAVFLGYTIVSYGSLKRLLWEKTAGNEVVLIDVVSELLKTNIFSVPAAPFVLLISLSCIFWLITYSDKPSIGKPIHQKQSVANLIIAFLLCLALVGYSYFLLYKEVPIKLTPDSFDSIYGLGIVAFAVLYIFAIIYTSVFILIERNYPFLLFNIINALGAQIMLVAVDARFAAAYKVMFPSLLLLSVFIFYSLLAFRHNTLYLSLAFFLITVSLQEKLLVLIGGLIVILSIISYLPMLKSIRTKKRIKLIHLALGALFCLICGAVFSATLQGYYKASIPQNYNLDAIGRYHEGEKNGVLLLKKVTPSYYGYNLGNWNTMPYFMKQCYGIKDDASIEYIE